jgi:hypothetical protein
MGQEFFINSQELEDKIRQLLPSQGGAGAGFDLSASTQIIPIIDVTETASGSGLRVDLQSSFSHNSLTTFNVSNATTTVINNTGYWRIHGVLTMSMSAAGSALATIILNDGATDKICWGSQAGYGSNAGTVINTLNFDFIVFLAAGDSLKMLSADTNSRFLGSARQLASIDGVLFNPT